MRSDIFLAVVGALIGVTIGQLKGDIIREHLSRFFRIGKQKVVRRFPRQSDNPSE
jgi:hypothetical protein